MSDIGGTKPKDLDDPGNQFHYNKYGKLPSV